MLHRDPSNLDLSHPRKVFEPSTLLDEELVDRDVNFGCVGAGARNGQDQEWGDRRASLAPRIPRSCRQGRSVEPFN